MLRFALATTDGIPTTRKENRGLLCCFLDVEEAYDNVPHASLFNCLSDLGLPEALLTAIKQLYSGNVVTASFARVTMEGDIYGQHEEIRRTALQGTVCSPAQEPVGIQKIPDGSGWSGNSERSAALLWDRMEQYPMRLCRETSGGPPSRLFMRKERFAPQVFEYLAATRGATLNFRG
ncbi:hypothetical protein HPB50_018085 [Hyalomma asiaticum]|uniref:Uncharacterized protein n=1 Tax=Hyalomma asiaticum TaxID=266040 RepID=A0ACB7S825_HYAAI|nr:hypothetical protein HPB50_018085 [Hyalomma asiaticum]